MPRLATPDINEKVLTMVAAIAGLQAALDQERRLVQADAGLHRIGEQREQRQQPERRCAQRLAAREAAVPGRARWPSRWRHRATVRRRGRHPPASHHQQPVRNEADHQHGDADRQPAGSPAAMQDAACAISGSATRPDHLRQGGDRRGHRAVRHEPVVHRAVDAQVERSGEVQCARRRTAGRTSAANW